MLSAGAISVAEVCPESAVDATRVPHPHRKGLQDKVGSKNLLTKKANTTLLVVRSRALSRNPRLRDVSAQEDTQRLQGQQRGDKVYVVT